jgi:hypothetical protein
MKKTILEKEWGFSSFPNFKSTSNQTKIQKLKRSTLFLLSEMLEKPEKKLKKEKQT